MPDNSSVRNENSALPDRAIKWLLAGERDTKWIRWTLVLAALLYFICLAMLGTGPINRYGNDALVLLDGGWRLLNGQIPYRDFYLALGPLEFMVTAFGMFLSRGSPQGISIGAAAFGAIIGLWGWLLARRRLLTVPALIVTAWLIVTATSPTPLGHPWSVISCGMIYNRQGYALLGLVLVECTFASERSRFWGGLSSGVALALLAFLKLNFFGAALLLLFVTVPVRRDEMQRSWGILAGTSCTVGAFILYLRFAVFAFLSDMAFAIHARASTLKMGGMIADLSGNAEIVALAVIAMAVTIMASGARPWQRNGARLILLGCIVIATASLLKETNAFDTGFQLVTLWIAILVGQLAAAYPRAKDKTAIVAVVVLGLATIAADFFLGAGSVMTLMRYNSPSVRSMGASLAAAHIPERYRHYTLDGYETAFRGADPSLGRAHLTARRFVEAYPVDTAGKGLLFTGSIGVGKTHLAVGMLRRLVQERGVKGLFCDYRELLKNIQNSYNPQVQTTELELLQPVFAAEVLVLDDLGAQKPNEWVWDTVALILNTRYNDKQTTIVTTNYPDLPAAGGGLTDPERAAREQTLGDRIGDRMRSRLAEMCVRVEMSGEDFRQTVKKARFG